MFLNPDFFNNQNNFIYSFTKLGALISSLGMLTLRKWGVILYSFVYAITCILFFVLDHPYETIDNQTNLVGGVIIVIVTPLCGRRQNTTGLPVDE